MTWLLVLSIYAGPANSVDWNGPWKLSISQVMDRRFQSEPECRNTAIQTIARMHNDMLAPVRFKCIQVETTLPKGAPR